MRGLGWRGKGDLSSVCRTAVEDVVDSITKPNVGQGGCRNQVDGKATSRQLVVGQRRSGKILLEAADAVGG